MQVDFIEEEVKGVLSPTDEIEIWQENERENYSSQSGENLRRKAELINGHFNKVAKQFYDLDTMELGSVTGFVDQIQDTLEAIWNDQQIHPPYS